MPITTSQSSASHLSNVSGSSKDFDALLRHRLHKWCGVHLDDSKSYLVQNRLRPLLRELGIESIADLVRRVDESRDRQLQNQVVDALTTHETLFFRDQSPFQTIESEIIPAVRKEASARGTKPSLRIWSAACSSGQEPYSVAIKLLESLWDFANWQISITASDVSNGTIDQAKRGIYREHELRRGLSSQQQGRFFTRNGADWQVKDEVRKMINFNIHNLIKPLPVKQQFDLVMCRNVLIYFTAEDTRKVLENLAHCLSPEGYLFVGCSEILRGVDDLFQRVTLGKMSCYRLRCFGES